MKMTIKQSDCPKASSEYNRNIFEFGLEFNGIACTHIKEVWCDSEGHQYDALGNFIDGKFVERIYLNTERHKDDEFIIDMDKISTKNELT